ncbi:MAG: LON peptidase substrate-binding domain-containing protein [Actinomycetota bacterium]
MRRLPMFPLGTVLFPDTLLPLHVFEPRYRALVADCLAGDGEFGVVLIERGSEVGGEDVRFEIGTVATIVDAQQIPDGRWFMLAEGRVRLRVLRWLPDDPYPVAEVEEIGDPEWFDTEGMRDRAVRALRRMAALRTELGEDVRSITITVNVDEDPVRASYEAVALAPIGPLDSQRLLAAGSPAERYEGLFRLLEEETAVLEQRIAEGWHEPPG